MPTPDESYPYLSDVAKALTGADLPLPMPMIGLVVALVAATVVLRLELRRRWEPGSLVTAGDGGHRGRRGRWSSSTGSRRGSPP